MASKITIPISEHRAVFDRAETGPERLLLKTALLLIAGSSLALWVLIAFTVRSLF
jgi:hypothetical protein